MECARVAIVLLAALMMLVNTSGATSCDPNPCQNSGTCVCSGNTYVCKCTQQYTGTNCQSVNPNCFTTNSTVMLESGRHIAIQDVSVGDRLLSFDSNGKLLFSEVAMWLDRAPQVNLALIQFTTQAGKTFKATPQHLVHVGDTFTSMRDVKIGDELLVTDDGKQMHKEKVESILEISDGIGAFAPLTHEGTIVVDGVAASCYSYSHRLGEIAFTPMKLLSKLGVVSGKADGMHWYSRVLVDWTEAVGMSQSIFA